MKNNFLALCLILCLLFSGAAVTPVRADDGDGHDVGYHCTETIDCPPDALLAPLPPEIASDSATSSAEDSTYLLLLEQIVDLLF